jgi:hypothetical protein
VLLDSFGFGFFFSALLPSTVFATSLLSSNNCRNTFGDGLDCLLCMYVCTYDFVIVLLIGFVIGVGVESSLLQGKSIRSGNCARRR